MISGATHRGLGFLLGRMGAQLRIVFVCRMLFLGG